MHLRTPYWREYARKNRNRKREIYRKSAERLEFKEARKIYNQEWRKNNGDKLRANRIKWIFKDKARQVFKEAVRSGRITRMPCEECGKPKGHGHHPDYSKPLEVKWLCRTHHMRLHRKSKST